MGSAFSYEVQTTPILFSVFLLILSSRGAEPTQGL